MPKPENIEPHKFKKGKSGNPNGRPPKLLTSLMRELTDAGYERVGPSMIVEAYELLLGLDEEKIKDLISDKKQPMSMRIVGKAMLTGKGIEILEKMMDRAHGRPKTEATVRLEKTSFDVGFE